MDIYVSNLAAEVTAGDLREVFELFGKVDRADVRRRRFGDESTSSGFVEMAVRNEGVCAILSVHGRNLKGCAMAANEVRPRDPVSGACRPRCRCCGGVATRNTRPFVR